MQFREYSLGVFVLAFAILTMVVLMFAGCGAQIRPDAFAGHDSAGEFFRDKEAKSGGSSE